MSYHGENDNEKEIGAHTMMCSWDCLHVNVPIQSAHTQAPTSLSCHQSIFISLQERGKESDRSPGVKMDAASTKPNNPIHKHQPNPPKKW